MPPTTEYKIHETEIPGLLEIDISLIEDARGFFQEKFQKEKLVAAGFPKDFIPVQHNISYSKEAGVTRGLHAEPWDKYITVITGKVYAVFVDLRGWESFGKVVSIEIDNRKAVFLPKGVANSYQTLVPDVHYSYLVNAHWSPVAKYVAINLGDPILKIDWPISLEQAIISEKDQKNPMLKEINL